MRIVKELTSRNGLSTSAGRWDVPAAGTAVNTSMKRMYCRSAESVSEINMAI